MNGLKLQIHLRRYHRCRQPSRTNTTGRQTLLSTLLLLFIIIGNIVFQIQTFSVVLRTTVTRAHRLLTRVHVRCVDVFR